MRGPVTASASVAIVTAALLACGAKPAAPPPREPPPRLLSVTLENVALRENAYVELHAWLAAAARHTTAPPPGLEREVEGYRRALADDEDDALLARTTAALAACTDDRCAEEALALTPLARPFGRALPAFVRRFWAAHVRVARHAIEIARKSIDAETDALLARIEGDLGITRPSRPPAVDVVAVSPPAGRAALVPVVLAARSSCFEKTTRSRVVDCVLVRLVLAERTKSPLAADLERELGVREGARAWSVLAIHAVAATLTAWEPKHVSPARRSAAAVERATLEWLAESHRPREPGFAARYAAAWRARHEL